MAEQERIDFHYLRSLEYKRWLVSGIIGGPNPQGLIVAHAYFEAKKLLDVQHGTVNPLGALEMEADPPGQSIEREVFATLIFQPHVARSVAQWLINQADTIEKAQKQSAQDNPS